MRKFISYLGIVLMVLLECCTKSDAIKETVTDNKIRYDNREYKLTAGIEEIFKMDNNHSSSRINVTDGEFYSTQIVISGNLNLIWRAEDASIWLYVNMYAPDSNGLSDGTYEFMPNDTDEDDPDLTNKQFFKEGKVAVDLNNDGEIKSGSEYFQITEGTIKMRLNGDAYTIDFNLTLENNSTVNGSFTHDFDQV